MPIALERGGSGRSDGEGIVRRSGCGAGGDSPAGRSAVMALRIGLVIPGMEEEEEEANSCSSSIGRNSDCSGGSAGLDEEESGEAEVESAPQGPLDTTDALEEALPMRRGISKFYAGKSRSFTSLAEVTSSSSTKDLAKPQNAYTRKRKNLLAFSINWDRRHSASLPATRGSGSTPKRPANSSRSGGDTEAPAPPALRPPPHPNAEPRLPPSGASPPPRCHFSVRSLSLTDLQSAADPSIIPAGKHLGFN